MTPRIVRHRWDDIPLDKVTEMVARKTLGGAELSLTQAYFKKGTKVPAHAHDGEILLYVLQGVVVVDSGADSLTLREGDLLVVPPATPHQAEVIDDAFVLLIEQKSGVRTPRTEGR
jgi:quercetin dioxygenase-like cupin family protein